MLDKIAAFFSRMPDKIAAFFKRRAIHYLAIRLGPAFVILLGLFWDFEYFRTRSDWSLPILEPNTLYVKKKAQYACPGEVVYFRSVIDDYVYLRRVAAGPGSVLHLTATGYSLDGRDVAMTARWRGLAAAELAGADGIRVPKRHILMINDAVIPPEATEEDQTVWAHMIIPSGNIRKKVTAVIFSRDIRMIGRDMTVDC